MNIHDVFLDNGDLVSKYRVAYMSTIAQCLAVEGNLTFSGKVREVSQTLNCRQVVVLLPPEGTAWDREHAQRAAWPKDVDPDATYVLADADEIPRREVVTAWAEAHRGTTDAAKLDMDFFYYHLWWRKPQRWSNAVICTGRALEQYNPQQLRDMPLPIVPNAGWHLSYFMGRDEIRRKVEAFSHQEFNLPEFKADDHVTECLLTGQDLFLRAGENCLVNDVLDDYPDEIIAAHNAAIRAQL